jgi:hypothetical protein
MDEQKENEGARREEMNCARGLLPAQTLLMEGGDR